MSFFYIYVKVIVLKRKVYTIYTRNQKQKDVDTQKTTAPYEALNQSIKSSINKEPFPIYNLT